MRGAAILAVILMAAVTLPGQNYLITFSAKAETGQSIMLDSIVVTNLKQETSITLSGSDTLHLMKVIGVEDRVHDRADLTITPNPFKGECSIGFQMQHTGKAIMEIYDLAGRVVFRNDFLLPAGQHLFRAGGLKEGLWFLQLKTADTRQTKRVVSLGCQDASQPYIASAGQSTPLAPEAKISGAKNMGYMQYNDGERLLFKGSSDILTTVVVLVPTQNQEVFFKMTECADGDGNHYAVVHIGSKTWMTENLRTTRYNNNAPIANVALNTAWANLTTPAYCWYNNDSATHAREYGALYNWFAADTSASYNVCPVGWHVPSHWDFLILSDSLGGDQTSGLKLKETGTAHWPAPNLYANNSSGFTALPGGYRDGSNGDFMMKPIRAMFWASTTFTPPDAVYRFLTPDDTRLWYNTAGPKNGMSIRCIKD